MDAQGRPTNEAEFAMAGALAAGDRREYFRLLTLVPLYLPLGEMPAPDAAGDEPQTFVTWDLTDTTYLIAYTSPESLIAGAGEIARGYTVTNYAELRAKWPSEEWLLAVNPGRQLDCYLPIGSVQAAADGTLVVPTAEEAAEALARTPEVAADIDAFEERVRQLASRSDRPAPGLPSAPVRSETPGGGGTDPAAGPGGPEDAGHEGGAPEEVVPENDTERGIAEAVEAADLSAYVTALLSCEVVLPTAWPVLNAEQLNEPGFPWRPATGMESPTIEMFTSARRLAAKYPATTPTLTAPFMLVLIAWPDPSYALAVNPGGPFEFRLADEALGDLIETVEDALATELEADGTIVEGAVVPPPAEQQRT